MDTKSNCTISEHVPCDNGEVCLCGYFRKAKSDEFAKYIRDKVGDFYNFKQDVKQIVIEDVPHQYQDRLLELLSDNLTHERHLELIIPPNADRTGDRGLIK